jgi:hypothetical protein
MTTESTASELRKTGISVIGDVRWGTRSANQIFDSARVHQVAVVRRHGSWEMVETPELRQAKAEIKGLNVPLALRGGRASCYFTQ